MGYKFKRNSCYSVKLTSAGENPCCEENQIEWAQNRYNEYKQLSCEFQVTIYLCTWYCKIFVPRHTYIFKLIMITWLLWLIDFMLGSDTLPTLFDFDNEVVTMFAIYKSNDSFVHWF